MLPSDPPKKKPFPPSPAESVEHDSGYNESHGYGQGHGGPSGPGDAPSTRPATVVPTPDPDDPKDS